ncbi:Guanine nucleotide-binding protein negative regulator 1 [Purpureocillium lavendulum]|uniref:Guanine nucleotide-binding protein negative regulator 1 n=1 Tax=Purpureocillium lavendulum TaxID=1247861 RepID=A0AB34G707_9HYPO|nr:Guanine nucleotide-binding protein negative regulator 1 [Purpureocillium lavendulum]
MTAQGGETANNQHTRILSTMPIRVRSKAQPVRDASPVSARIDFELPDIGEDDSFRQVVRKLSTYFYDAIELPSTFEQLRTTAAGNCIRVLVDHLNDTCTNPAIVNALLALKWHYAADSEHQGLGEARSNACEIVAWRFLSRLSEREAMNYCLYEIPDPQADGNERPLQYDQEAGESSPLLPRILPSSGDESMDRPAGSSAKKATLLSSLSRLTNLSEETPDELDPTTAFKSLNALEIAAIADAKRFLSQHAVQKIITGIWNGDIVFWDSLSVHSTKKHKYYNPQKSDPYSRLRVPKYLKSWEVLFFAVFLALYYTVLIVRDEEHITVTEVILYMWIAAFFYDELTEWMDAGSVFYATDIWNLFDMTMILIGFAFGVLRVIGIVQQDKQLTDVAFNVLALEALFMMPRICSILSLSPYWGTLIPCLKEMGKDFLKFMVLVVIIYFGFLTTFSLVGRDTFGLARMTGILTKIFFGSSYVGFEIMNQIDPIFGPPLMIIFVTLSSILLMGSLTGMLSNSFSRVITHAKEEYLYVYSVYVLEASTSNRLTHFYPPFNLIALVIFRPLRLVFPRDDKFRQGRIILLKVTHLPIVGAIQLYELVRRRVSGAGTFKGPKEAARRRPRTLVRPTSGQHNRQLWPASPRFGSRSAERQREVDEFMDAPSAVEVQISELTSKIDKLTAVVVALQEGQSGSKASSDTLRYSHDDFDLKVTPLRDAGGTFVSKLPTFNLVQQQLASACYTNEVEVPASMSLLTEEPLGGLSATEIHDAIQGGKVTVQQYAQSLIRRIEDRDSIVHAWVHFDKEAILSQAKALDAMPPEARGPLHGVAVGIKDIFLARDMPTRYFSPIHEHDGRGASDSAAVGVLRSAGALILGKTATTELAATTVGGPCVNPRSVDGKVYTPGGSSSGSAAAVADRQVPLAVGTQTGGSIVRPGSFCGVWALKPTWGLVSTEGVSRFSVTCDTVGFFANTADDLDLVSRVFRLDIDNDSDDEASRKPPFQVAGARIAMIKTHVWELAKPATRAAWERGRELLVAAGALVDDVNLPGEFARCHAWREVVAGSEARSAFLSRYSEDKDKLHESLRPFVERRHTPGRKEILEAHDGIAALRREWDSLAAQYDAVITPSVTGEAPEGLGDTGSAIFNAMWTVLHAPTLNVPGFVGPKGLPVGLTVVGGRYTDMEVLKAGKAIGEVFRTATKP